MKPYKYLSATKNLRKRIARDDMSYLQKKITGKSVYKSLRGAYRRTPKHKKSSYSYQD